MSDNYKIVLVVKESIKMQSMNIAILIPWLVGGGAERTASLIGSYYAQNGHKVYYFLAGNLRKKSTYEIKGKIVHTPIESSLQSGPVDLLRAARIMRKYKKKYNIDISISFMEEFNHINILSKGRDVVFINICTILSQRDEWADLFMYRKQVLRFMYNHADKVIVMTDYAVREMSHRYGIRKEKLIKIPNPLPYMEAHTEEGTWEYGEHTIICVGRLVDVKQHNIAIRAFGTVLKRVPDAKMIILGDGPNKGRLNLLIKRMGLEKDVFLMGFQKNVAYYLQHAKVFLMTSRTEGFGNGMLEAMSLSVPVVAIDNPASREILKITERKCGAIEYGEYGILTPHTRNQYMDKEPVTDRERIFGEAVAQILEKEEMRQHYAKKAKERAEMYRIDPVMRMWNEMIGKELDRRKNRKRK